LAKKGDSKEDLAKLLNGLRMLGKIEAVCKLHIGVPADTARRDVMDGSYSVSERMFFDDVAGHQNYQNHPIHKEFM